MKTTASYTQMVMNPVSNEGIFVDSLDGLAEGQIIYVAGGGYYLVQELGDYPAPQVFVVNLCCPQNAIPGAVVPRGSLVVPASMPPITSVRLPTVNNYDVEMANVILLPNYNSGGTLSPVVFSLFGATGAEPIDGARVAIYDMAGEAATNNLTISANIVLPGAAPANPVTLALANAYIDMTYAANASTWIATGYSPGH